MKGTAPARLWDFLPITVSTAVVASYPFWLYKLWYFSGLTAWPDVYWLFYYSRHLVVWSAIAALGVTYCILRGFSRKEGALHLRALAFGALACVAAAVVPIDPVLRREAFVEGFRDRLIETVGVEVLRGWRSGLEDTPVGYVQTEGELPEWVDRLWPKSRPTIMVTEGAINVRVKWGAKRHWGIYMGTQPKSRYAFIALKVADDIAVFYGED